MELRKIVKFGILDNLKQATKPMTREHVDSLFQFSLKFVWA